MVVESVPFNFPRTGRMEILDGTPGFAAEFHYSNGYSVSVARNVLTAGGRHGLFSLVMINPDSGCIISCREIHGEADEPVGWLTPDEVDELLTRVTNLPNRNQD